MAFDNQCKLTDEVDRMYNAEVEYSTELRDENTRLKEEVKRLKTRLSHCSSVCLCDVCVPDAE